MKTLEHEVSVSSCRFIKLGDFVVNDDKMTHKTHVLAFVSFNIFLPISFKGYVLEP